MHSTGIIEYAVDTNEIESCKLEIEVIHDQVSSVTIEARDSQLILRFHTIGVFPEDNESAMNDLASRCFTYLAHTYGFSIRNMRRGGSTLPQRNGELSTVINAFGLSWNIEAPKKSLDNAVQSTIQKSIGIIELDIQLIHEFVIARSEIDKVSRFMFLYNLALQMHGDNQKTLDESILRLESRCSVSRGPKFNGGETIYTRLRNQVSHCRGNTNIDTTRKEIEGMVNAFQQVVLEMLPNP